MDTGPEVLRLEAHGQRLAVVPALGAGVVEWSLATAAGPLHLWRPGDPSGADRFLLSAFALLPWCNRIGSGGFGHGGTFHAVAPNRAGERYPIHGDGWLQAWSVASRSPNTLALRVVSRGHGGNPHHYEALQTFTLRDGALVQRLEVTHLGDVPLPYGLGFHPWFERTPPARVQADVAGAWLCGDDMLPAQHVARLPAELDIAAGIGMEGPTIDNCFTGWTGVARVAWPDRGAAVDVRMAPVETPRGPQAPDVCQVYRPDDRPALCLEPVTHPVDAFHLPGRPGLVVLARGETMALHVAWCAVFEPARRNG